MIRETAMTLDLGNGAIRPGGAMGLSIYARQGLRDAPCLISATNFIGRKRFTTKLPAQVYFLQKPCGSPALCITFNPQWPAVAASQAYGPPLGFFADTLLNHGYRLIDVEYVARPIIVNALWLTKQDYPVYVSLRVKPFIGITKGILDIMGDDYREEIRHRYLSGKVIVNEHRDIPHTVVIADLP
jgi:hypothetical protein